MEGEALMDSLFNNLQTPVTQPIPQPEMQQTQPQVIEGTRIPKSQQQPVQQVQQQPVPQPVQQQVQDPMTVLCNVKEFYSDMEWKQRYDLYGTECSKINHIDPTRLSPSDIAVTASQIEQMLIPVRIDHANMKSLAYKYESILKVTQEIEFKDEIERTLQAGGKKPTIDETKAMVTKTIKSRAVFEDNIDLFTAKIRYNTRAIQIQAILDILNDKKDALITYAAALKVDSSINNFTPQVPTNQQFNQMRN